MKKTFIKHREGKKKKRIKVKIRTRQNGHRQSHDPARLAIKNHSVSLFFGNILLEASPIDPYLVRLRRRGATFTVTTCYPSLLPTLSRRHRQDRHPASALSSRFGKVARDGMLTKRRMTGDWKRKTQARLHRGSKDRPVSEKDQPAGAGRRAAADLPGELL